MKNMAFKNKWFLICLFGLSFLVRMVFFEVFLSKNENYWTGDSVDYHNVAVNISQSKGIVDNKGKPWFYYYNLK